MTATQEAERLRQKVLQDRDAAERGGDVSAANDKLTADEKEFKNNLETARTEMTANVPTDLAASYRPITWQHTAMKTPSRPNGTPALRPGRTKTRVELQPPGRNIMLDTAGGSRSRQHAFYLLFVSLRMG
jgi:hypothetical protein